MTNKYYFVVDTDEYSGNFERELCAYITAQTGECGVGSDIADFAYNESKKEVDIFFNLVETEPDEDGCWRPVKIYPTPGWYNDGMGKHYKANNWKEGKPKYPAYQSVAILLRERPTQQVIDLMKNRAEKYAEISRSETTESIGGYKSNKFNITGFRLVEKETVTKEETI